MVIKTREKLIDVARQLFAHKGIENTTMNDIATASDKGRRTIYTYFKNKREIYNAVIERESEQLVSRLREVVNMEIPPVEKLEKFLLLRFEIIKDAIVRHDSLLSFFTWDLRRVDRIRRLASAKEDEILNAILVDGVKQGVFRAEQAKMAPTLINTLMQGVDFLFFRDNPDGVDVNKEQTRDYTVNLS
ncbi:MAG: TetR/AcrR family transcriptional regulator [Muribaculaceae bacterium]|nr:TetR/AcrR family transcriptional regulator [Muribaculaceae bacterium]